MYIASQICELIALLIDLIAYHFKTKKRMIVVSNIGCFFNILHYLFLGAFSGCAAKVITFIRNAIIVEKENRKGLNNIFFLVLFVILYLVFGVITYNGLYTVIPTIICIIYLLCIWNGNELNVKGASCLCTLLWIIYNVFIMSYAGILTNAVLFISTAIAYIRERKKQVKRKNYG